MLQQFIEINSHRIGLDCPVYVIAEISANHNQDFDQAAKLIEVARDAGANAVKLQTYTADTLTIDSRNSCFRVGGGTLWDGRNLHDLYRDAFTPWEWQPKLKAIANRLGLDLFSTPFDATAVDFLERMDVPAHKIASFELVDLPLIAQVARTHKPIIMSTGMASMDEIAEAVNTAEQAGATQIALMKCTSAYPAPPEDLNLRTISHLAETFRVPVGLSDHTMGSAVPIAAVALGASLVEKHITLSRGIPGPDSAFSLEPHELKDMVSGIRTAEKALGHARYGPTDNERSGLAFRRSLFVVEDVRAGEIFTERNVRSIRPNNGLHTRYTPSVMGKQAARDIERGTPLSWPDIAGMEAPSSSRR